MAFESMRDPNRLWFWLVVLALLFIAVPYLFAGSSSPLMWGLPLWFIVSLSSALILAVFTVLHIGRRWRLAKHILQEEE